MEKQKQIELAKAHSVYNPADKYYVTTDEKVHTDATIAVSRAMSLSAGNPEVFEVEHSELGEVAPEGEVAPKGDKVSGATSVKAEKIEAAKDKVASLQTVVDDKTTARDNAESNKKGAATVAFNKAIANLEAAQKELADAEALTEE